VFAAKPLPLKGPADPAAKSAGVTRGVIEDVELIVLRIRAGTGDAAGASPAHERSATVSPNAGPPARRWRR